MAGDSADCANCAGGGQRGVNARNGGELKIARELSLKVVRKCPFVVYIDKHREFGDLLK